MDLYVVEIRFPGECTLYNPMAYYKTLENAEQKFEQIKKDCDALAMNKGKKKLLKVYKTNYCGETKTNLIKELRIENSYEGYCRIIKIKTED